MLWKLWTQRHTRRNCQNLLGVLARIRDSRQVEVAKQPTASAFADPLLARCNLQQIHHADSFALWAGPLVEAHAIAGGLKKLHTTAMV